MTNYLNANRNRNKEIDFHSSKLNINIPNEIWKIKDLSLPAKCLWSLLNSQYDKELNGAPFRFKDLSDFFGITVRYSRKLFKELESLKLVEHISYDGRITVRKAVFPKKVGAENE